MCACQSDLTTQKAFQGFLPFFLPPILNPLPALPPHPPVRTNSRTLCPLASVTVESGTCPAGRELGSLLPCLPFLASAHLSLPPSFPPPAEPANPPAEPSPTLPSLSRPPAGTHPLPCAFVPSLQVPELILLLETESRSPAFKGHRGPSPDSCLSSHSFCRPRRIVFILLALVPLLPFPSCLFLKTQLGHFCCRESFLGPLRPIRVRALLWRSRLPADASRQGGGLLTGSALLPWAGGGVCPLPSQPRL